MKKKRQTTQINLLIRCVVAVYLIYLAHSIIMELDTAPNVRLMAAFAIAFTFAGVLIIAFAIKAYINKDYKDFLVDLYKSKQRFDIIFVDPPYDLDISTEAVELILRYKLLNHNGIIIIETDQKEREIKKIADMQVEIYDTRKYGRVNLIFLVERG